VPEIIDRGVTGFVVDNVDEAVATIPLAQALDRDAIRGRFEKSFSVERMAGDYVMLYNELIRSGRNAVLTSATAVQVSANAA
jgi:glycosyltransferase involved in cell wall biosynthesis